MTSKLSLAFFSVLLLANNIFAKNVTSKEAKNILAKALKLQKTRSFAATKSSGEGKIFQKIFQRLNSDGTTYKRVEIKCSVLPTRLFIKNDSGRFDIFENLNIALKSNFEQTFMDYDKYASYTIKTGVYKKIPCYIINKKIEANEDTFQIFIKGLPDALKKGRTPKQLKRDFEDSFFAVIVYHIGKEDSFIYSVAFYTINGKLSSENSYKTVNLNPKLSDSLFVVPSNSSIEIANNFSQYLKKDKELIIKSNAQYRK